MLISLRVPVPALLRVCCRNGPSGGMAGGIGTFTPAQKSSNYLFTVTVTR